MIDIFNDRKSASAAAAEKIAAAVKRRLDAQKAASLVVSGGTSPVDCLAELSQKDLDWERVEVLASDDRWVPPDHDDSNEKLVREHLLTGKAAAATFIPYYSAGTSPAERCRELDEDIRFIPFPFACALLGMGADGHFASLFPDADNLATGLDPESTTLCIPVTTAASPHARISLTLSALARSDEIVLLIFGDEKRRVFEDAIGGNETYPVRRLLMQKHAPVNTYWAP